MNKSENNIPLLVIISGPSGVGKTTICSEVVKRVDNVYLSTSLTSRAKAEEEVNGQHYRFVSREKFENMIQADELLEYAEVFGNLYGTPREPVEQALQEGKTAILEIDVQGAKQVKTIYPDAVMIFILPPRQQDLAERMNGRGREDEKTAEQRLNLAGTEIAAAWQHYDNMVINDELEQAVEEVVQIIKKERERKTVD